MKDNLLNRRKLLGVVLATTSTAALASPMSVIDFLRSSEGELKVAGILKKYLPLASDEKFLSEFYRSLVGSDRHNESRDFLMEHLEKKELEHRLETYVLEEFLISTNYFSVRDGQDSRLKMSFV